MSQSGGTICKFPEAPSFVQYGSLVPETPTDGSAFECYSLIKQNPNEVYNSIVEVSLVLHVLDLLFRIYQCFSYNVSNFQLKILIFE